LAALKEIAPVDDVPSPEADAPDDAVEPLLAVDVLSSLPPDTNTTTPMITKMTTTTASGP
jgi:hypothetical protein